jgi:hypothetical protein
VAAVTTIRDRNMPQSDILKLKDCLEIPLKFSEGKTETKRKTRMGIIKDFQLVF